MWSQRGTEQQNEMEKDEMIWHYRNIEAVNALNEAVRRVGIAIDETQLRDLVDIMVNEGFGSLVSDDADADEAAVTFATVREYENALDEEKDRINDEWIAALHYAIGGNLDSLVDGSGIVIAHKLDDALENWRHERQGDDIADGLVIDVGDLDRSEVERVQAFVKSIRETELL